LPVFEARYRVWWSETDAAGIVHFSNFFRYCERAEEEFLRGLGVRCCRAEPGDAAIRGPRFVMPRVRAECEYLFPLWPGDEYSVSIDDVVLGRKSIQYRFTIRNLTRGGRVSARCTIVAVAYDTERGEAIEIPGDVRDALLKAGARLRDDVAAGGAAGGAGAPPRG